MLTFQNMINVMFFTKNINISLTIANIIIFSLKYSYLKLQIKQLKLS